MGAGRARHHHRQGYRYERSRNRRGELRVTNKETGTTVTSRSSVAGNYTIPYLLPGVCNLTAEFSGFKKVERQGIEVRVNDVLNIDIPSIGCNPTLSAGP